MLSPAHATAGCDYRPIAREQIFDALRIIVANGRCERLIGLRIGGIPVLVSDRPPSSWCPGGASWCIIAGTEYLGTFAVS